LHAGSLVAALASWLDARAHGGQWLVRIEDVDTPRTLAGATECIVQQLQACGLVSDEPVVQQSPAHACTKQRWTAWSVPTAPTPCSCSRKDIAWALERLGRPPQRHGERVYPGTCRTGLPPGHPPDAPAPGDSAQISIWKIGH
jgi:glutamyl-Q tRNA(Asp) synthetase